jgi:thymidylate kinase
MTVDKPQRPQRAALVVFEGPDEMGKTTLAKTLVDDLRKEGNSVVYRALPGIQTGTLGQLVYQLHHDDRSLGLARPIHPAGQQMLHIAAHLDAIEQDILPQLGRGASVVLDRFWWSTWAYGAAAGLKQDLLDKMVDVEVTLWGSVVPDALFLVRRYIGVEAGQGILWHWYEHLAMRETSHYPIHLLHNDGTIEEAIERARAHLPPLAIE